MNKVKKAANTQRKALIFRTTAQDHFKTLQKKKVFLIAIKLWINE